MNAIIHELPSDTGLEGVLECTEEKPFFTVDGIDLIEYVQNEGRDINGRTPFFAVLTRGDTIVAQGELYLRMSCHPFYPGPRLHIGDPQDYDSGAEDFRAESWKRETSTNLYNLANPPKKILDMFKDTTLKIKLEKIEKQ
ncbi:hypothetical protein KY330_04280 [Candidatus Woesearchaeota archaeon]|nr:hypothetical protein [Candidatus Woesearchaeota archaeon]